MKKKTIIIIFLALIIISAFIYFVAGVSATLPPIREYEYGGNSLQLIDSFRTVGLKHSDIVFKVEDTVGGASRGYAYNGTITIKNKSDSLLYELKWFNINDGKFKSKLLLIGAHDLINGSGGYGIKADGMEILLDKFDSKILTRLKNYNGATIKPL